MSEPDGRPGTGTVTVLVVDDQPSVRTLLHDYLAAVGFRVVTAENGRAALDAVRRETPDIVLLDIMMPEMDGLEFLRVHRQESGAPVILLTARLTESDKVVGLELGADDYVTKPFGMRELVARVHAVMRRAGPAIPIVDVLQASDVVLDRRARAVRVRDRPVDLTPSEFDLLALLMSDPGRVFDRATLLAHLQGPLSRGVQRTVDVHVRNLRTKIEPDPSHPRYVETVFGVGYRFRSE